MFFVNDIDSHKKKLKKASASIGFMMIIFLIFIYVYDFALILGVNAVYNGGFEFSKKYLAQSIDFFYGISPLMVYVENAVIQIFSLITAIFLTGVVFKIKPMKLLSFKNNPISLEENNEKKSGMYLKVFAMIFAINMATSFIMNLINLIFESTGVKIPDVDFSFSKNNIDTLIIMFLATVVAAPLIEEIIFRGILLKRLSPYGVWFATIITSFLFALLHGNIMQGVGAFCIGIILSIVTIKSGSILPAIILHAMNNFVPFLTSVLMNESEIIAGIFSYFMLIVAGIGAFLIIIKKDNLKMNEPSTAMLSKSQAMLTFFTQPLVFIYVAYEIFNVVRMFFVVN